MSDGRVLPKHDQRWAHFRFSVVGPLLAAPPPQGELQAQLASLAAKQWRHPITSEPCRFGLSTIERWYYQALHEQNDPVGALVRKIREDNGKHPSCSAQLVLALAKQYNDHKSWSYKLHFDNLAVLVKADERLGPLPSYPSVCRYLRAHGMHKRQRLSSRRTAGVENAEQRIADFEIRSYESAYCNALWHLDFHVGSLKVMTADGRWVQPRLFGMLDDRSRVCCHAQWYLAETAENLVHGLCQGLQKFGLPRALMSDNGAAMTAEETTQGLQRLGLVHEKTLPYCAFQNGKQEVFWAQVEGRLVAMLENCRELTLLQLNEATLAWVDLEYNRKVHSELGQSPLNCYVACHEVGRSCPSSDDLRLAFATQIGRKQRRSDGTITVGGIRYEVPSRYRHMPQLSVRYASWDLANVYLVDQRSGTMLTRLYPQDKRLNASGQRRQNAPLTEDVLTDTPKASSGEIAPLLRKLIAEYAATGLPPAYLPKDELTTQQEA